MYQVSVFYFIFSSRTSNYYVPLNIPQRKTYKKHDSVKYTQNKKSSSFNSKIFIYFIFKIEPRYKRSL